MESVKLKDIFSSISEGNDLAQSDSSRKTDSSHHYQELPIKMIVEETYMIQWVQMTSRENLKNFININSTHTPILAVTMNSPKKYLFQTLTHSESQDNLILVTLTWKPWQYTIYNFRN